MSRSKQSKCPDGRGCWVCGNAGEARRLKEQSSQVADRFDLSEDVDLRWDYRRWMEESVDQEDQGQMDGEDRRGDCI